MYGLGDYIDELDADIKKLKKINKKYETIIRDIANAYFIDGDEIDRDVGVGNVLEKHKITSTFGDRKC